jgi:hypothetical protein
VAPGSTEPVPQGFVWAGGKYVLSLMQRDGI